MRTDLRVIVFFGLILAASTFTVAQSQADDACTGNDDGAPCYSGVNDILSGQRELLPDDDLYVTVRYKEEIRDFALDTSSLAISSASSDSYSANCPAQPDALTQSLVGRMFALANDVVVSLRQTSDCSELKLHVSDPQNSDNDSTGSWNLGNPGTTYYAGMGMGDFNLDGYQDIIYVDDKTAQVYTAACNYDPFSDCKSQGDTPADGLVRGPAYTPSTVGPYSGPPITGDFNGDGMLDAAWPAYNLNNGHVYIELVSICPAADAVINGQTCSQWGEILPLTSIDTGGVVNVTKNDGPRPVVALDANNFDGAVNTQTGIADDELLAAMSDSKNTHVTLTAYDYNASTGAMDPESSLTWPEKLYPDGNNNIQLFLGSAAMDEDSSDIQAVFASTKESNSKDHVGFVGIITFKSDLTMNETFQTAPNSDKTRFFGMAVGRFDPPDKNNGDTDFDKQVAVLVDHNDNNTLLQIYSVDPLNVYQPVFQYQYEVTSDRLFDNSVLALAALQTGDLQGRSLLLGAPEKVTMSQTQPNVILGLPPMHVDFIEPLGGGDPKVFNVSVFPSTFYAQFDFNGSSGTQGSHQGTTSYAAAYKESVGLKIRYGPPAGDSVTYKFKLAVNETHQRTVTTTWDTYTGEAYDLTAQTQFDDKISSTSKQLNIYSYPVIGQYICPSDATDCPSDCSTGESPCEPLMVQYSGPDNVVYGKMADASGMEWYQPVTEPGNIFSYPGSLDLLKQSEPQLTGPDTQSTQTALDLLTPPNIFWDSQSSQDQSVSWEADSSVSKSVSIANAVSFDAGISVKLKASDVVTSATAKFGFDTDQSFSTSSLNTSTQSLDASTGVVLSRGLGPNGLTDVDELKYEGQSYIYALIQPIGSFQSAFQDNLLEGDIKSQGPLKVAHAADMLSTDSAVAQSGDWWKQVYAQAPDIALNHPQRWTLNQPTSQNTQEVLFNCPVGYTSDYETPTDDPGSCVENVIDGQQVEPNPLNVTDAVFYQMKGLFITPGTDNGPTVESGTLGDTMTLQARVYNYSLKNMPDGTIVHVRFYAQPWDSINGQFSSGSAKYGFDDAVYIGEDMFAEPVPAFCGGSQGDDSCKDSDTPSNWTLAKVQWDTSTLSPSPVVDTTWKFWVVAWMEDSSGNLVQEIPQHGLTAIPGDNLSSLAEVPVETYSNNLGFYNQVFTLFLPEENTSVSAPSPADAQRTMAIEDIEPSENSLLRHRNSTLRVRLRAEGGRYDHVMAFLFEGNPDYKHSTLLDMDIIPRIHEDESFVVPFRYTPTTCGARKLYVRTFMTDGGPPVTRAFKLKVRCDEEHRPKNHAYYGRHRHGVHKARYPIGRHSRKNINPPPRIVKKGDESFR